MKKWNKKHWLCVIAISVLVISDWLVLGNTDLEITEYYVSSSRIPVPFDGFEIAQISDLHNAEFGDENKAVCIFGFNNLYDYLEHCHFKIISEKKQEGFISDCSPITEYDSDFLGRQSIYVGIKSLNKRRKGGYL